MSLCLVTGANGFIGQPLCNYLLAQGLTVRGSVRSEFNNPPKGLALYTTADIDGATAWHTALSGVQTVIHLAGTVHRPSIQDPAIYQRSIVEATANLAAQAKLAGVQRFIYLSSSHVYGVAASPTPIAETHACIPMSGYAQAKRQAELILQQQMGQSPMQIVIVRPPLVYGPGVKANFAQLIKWVNTLPCLPLGCATQPRSLVGVDNLNAFLYRCMLHPQAANAVFNISDDQDLSTRALCEQLAKLLAKKRLFLAIPAPIMQMGLGFCGKASVYAKLFESVCLDTQLAKNRLGWQPPFGVADQLAKTVAALKKA